MFERLKRALSGSTPKQPSAPPAPTEPGRLDWITRGTPYRFRTWLADPSQRNDVTGILDALIRGELTVDFIDEPDGRVRLDMVSTFEGWAAVHRVLYTLRRAGVRVRGLERLDMFDDVSPAELESLVNDWEIGEYKTAARRRTDTLTGEATLRYAIGVSRRKPKVRAWRTIAASVAHYTPGVDTFLLETAASDPNATWQRPWLPPWPATARWPNWCQNRSIHPRSWSWLSRDDAIGPQKPPIGSRSPSPRRSMTT